MHEVWRRVRRPFRVPHCCGRGCTWEIYDIDKAGCLRCGRSHVCYSNAVDSVCPLVELDDQSRACSITGFVLNEVRHAHKEFSENVGFFHEDVSRHSLNEEIYGVVASILKGHKAALCREQENMKLHAKLETHMFKQMKLFKLKHPNVLPNVALVLASALGQVLGITLFIFFS